MIDQSKIGSFLKELRREKGLTQEALAERFGVSSRSVSRWETGATLPDLVLLVELADFYEVDLGEIVAGERKIMKMEKETKETYLRIADYAETEKAAAVRRKVFVTGVITAMAGLVLGVFLIPGIRENSAAWIDRAIMGVGIIGLIVLWSMVLIFRRRESAASARSAASEKKDRP